MQRILGCYSGKTNFLKVLVIKNEVCSSYEVEECKLLQFSTNRLISSCILSYYEEHFNLGGTQGTVTWCSRPECVGLVAGSAHSLLAQRTESACCQQRRAQRALSCKAASVKHFLDGHVCRNLSHKHLLPSRTTMKRSKF